MFGFKRKTEIVPKIGCTETAGAHVWLVSWDARFGSFSDHKKRVAKAFLNRADAEAFIEALNKAKEILQNTECLHIELEEQK